MTKNAIVYPLVVAVAIVSFGHVRKMPIVHVRENLSLKDIKNEKVLKWII